MEWEKDPTSILRRAVYGMLPKNRLRKARMLRLPLLTSAVHAPSWLQTAVQAMAQL